MQNMMDLRSSTDGVPRQEDVSEKQHTPTPPKLVSVSAALEDDAEFKAGKWEFMILGTMALLNIILAVDATILPPALPTLAKTLNGTAIETFWAGSSFLLANAVFVPFLGSVSDLFGRCAVLLFSLVMFTGGTLIACLATTFTALLSGRTIQGVGAAGIYALSYIVTTDIIPLRQRPKFQSIIVAAWAIGTVIGPLVGGVVAEHARWQWIFYVNFPFCALGFLAVPIVFGRLKLQHKPAFGTAIRRVDWIGSCLFILGASAFLLGLTWGGVQYDWNLYQTWLPMILGGLAVLAALLYEAYFLPRFSATANILPLIRMAVFKGLSARLVFLLGMLGGFELYAHLYYLPFYMIAVKGLSATLTGVYIMATTLLTVPVSVVTGVLMTRLGAFRWAIRLGFACLVVSNGVLLLTNQYRSLVAHLFLILTISFGHGLVVLSLSIATQAVVSNRDIRDTAQAVSMFIFLRQFGICLGVAVGGTVFDNVLRHAIERRAGTPGLDLPYGIARDIARNSAAFAAGPLNALPEGDQKTALLDAYVEGFHAIFYLLLSIAAFSLLLSFLIKHHDMNKQLSSQHQLEGKRPGMPAEQGAA
ncbi:Major Facilitator Superfamily domain containing protein [Naviculisporaceae sp. PSN 640]